MTQSGIESATFRLVAQHLNHCATAVPYIIWKFDVFYQCSGKAALMMVATTTETCT